MPEALKYGMSTHEFWHEDKKLYQAYQKAYYSRLSETSWLNGLYVNVALNNLAGNIFKKKGSKAYEYPDKPIDIIGKYENRVTKANMEGKFRQLMSNSTDWLKTRNNKNIKNNKK